MAPAGRGARLSELGFNAVNRLAKEASPYLRQHRDNPVDWYPWGDEAFAAARERNVPIILSIGYSSCHWCHVMEREAFSDADIAALMNDKFVAIKVDREERPDVDAVYMDALQAITGRGGWPLTVALDHDRQAFWGGTYFPQDAFEKVLNALDDAWHNQQEQIATSTRQILQKVNEASTIKPATEIPTLETINQALNQLAAAHDKDNGGFGKAPKFPSAHHLTLMLRAFMTTGNEAAKEIVTNTLNAMAAGGIYDHVGGGFMRYSTDDEWLVPHFEKMLSDQGLMVRLYRESFAVFGDPLYRRVVEETIGYVLRDMTHPDGGFFTAEDADSAGPDGSMVEGLFYTWTPTELRNVFKGAKVNDQPLDVDEVLDWFDITGDGNLNGRSIPNRRQHRDDQMRPPTVEAARRALVDIRNRRPRPARDEKVLLEWNALFLYALADAAAAFQRDDWKQAAVRNAEFLLANLRGDDGRWMRSWQDGAEPAARHDALAADHTALIEAFLRVAELTGEARWIDEALDVADWLLDDFFDPVVGGLWTAAEYSEHLVVRQKDTNDNSTPSANSTAAIVLQRLAALTGESRFANLADRILHLLAGGMEDKPLAMMNGLVAAEMRHRGLVEVVIPGDTSDRESTTAVMARMAQMLWRPNIVLVWGERWDSPLWDGREDATAYVCRNNVCDEPITESRDLFEKLTGRPLPEGAKINV